MYTKHGVERHHPKTENLLYQNQSHSVYKKSKKKQIHVKKKDVNTSSGSVYVVLALFNCIQIGVQYMWCWLYSTVIQVEKLD